MRRLTVIVSLVLFWALSFVIPTSVSAGGGDLVCGCEWEQINCNVDPYTGDHVCTYSCPCGSGGGTCDAGYYRCNTGCCKTCGGGVCPGDTGGGGRGECAPAVNCPAGWTPSWGQDPVKVRVCDQSDPGACYLGTAQKNIGCCVAGKTDENGDWYCGSVQYATYPCCPPGSTEMCPIIDRGTEYSVLRGYNERFTCSDSYDIFIRTEISEVIKWGPIKMCTEYDEVAEKCIGEWYWYTEYYYNTTCHDNDKVCSCTPTCAVTAASGLTYDALANDIVWTPGQNGVSQQVYVSPYEADVSNGCLSGNCVVNTTINDNTTAGYSIVPELTPTTRYYTGIVTVESDTCSSPYYSYFDTPAATADAWWQTVNSSVHANSGGIYSQIPATCTGACVPSLLAGNSGLMSLTGSYDLGDGTISEDGTDWLADTVFRGATTGFAYFNRLLSDDPAGVGVWNGNLPGANGVYLIEDNITTSGDWDVAGNRAYVLLADGDVNIGGNINVAPGGFLAVIASGDINIDPAVTNVEGVFIADGSLTTGSSNAQLTAEGIFTAWTTVQLQRDLDDDTQTPAELFVYRPDLQVNAYRYLLWMNINWREVAP